MVGDSASILLHRGEADAIYEGNPPRAPSRHRPPAKELAVLYGESQTSQFVEAVRRLKEEQRKIERRTRQAKQKVKQHLRKSGRAG